MTTANELLHESFQSVEECLTKLLMHHAQSAWPDIISARSSGDTNLEQFLTTAHEQQIKSDIRYYTSVHSDWKRIVESKVTSKVTI